MSVELAKKEIRRLLASRDPEVVCISGRWGVGKTYAWHHHFKEAQARGDIALKRYSYVSLFGTNSLEDFKYAIFANSVDVVAGDVEPTLETVMKHVASTAKKGGKWSLPFFQNLPVVKNQIGVVSPLWFMMVRNSLVCIDDIERKGDKLSLRDVLGLVSHLKEQKNCKVVLILNDEKLDPDDPSFELYFEKVIDIYIKYAPTPKESVAIALPSSAEVDELIAASCVTLGISNIRLIEKIKRAVRKLEPLLTGYDAQVLRQAVQSLVLLAWCVYEPGDAPPIEYVKKYIVIMLGLKKEEAGEKEAAWNATLSAYNFTHMDEFDSTLLEGLRHGYYHETWLAEQAARLDKAIKNGASFESFKEAWELYHGSFEDNQAEVLDGIAASFKKNVQIIDPLNLNGTVVLFKDLGRPEQARELIDFYVKSRGDTPALFDLATWSFGNEVADPDVKEAFERKHREFKEPPKLGDVLLSIAEKQGWSPGDLEFLAASNIDDYYKLFKKSRSDAMQKMIWGAFTFRNMNDASGHMKEVVHRATEALKRIGRESTINARRVRRYGVQIDE